MSVPTAERLLSRSLLFDDTCAYYKKTASFIFLDAVRPHCYLLTPFSMLLPVCSDRLLACSLLLDAVCSAVLSGCLLASLFLMLSAATIKRLLSVPAAERLLACLVFLDTACAYC